MDNIWSKQVNINSTRSTKEDTSTENTDTTEDDNVLLIEAEGTNLQNILFSSQYRKLIKTYQSKQDKKNAEELNMLLVQKIQKSPEVVKISTKISVPHRVLAVEYANENTSLVFAGILVIAIFAAIVGLRFSAKENSNEHPYQC